MSGRYFLAVYIATQYLDKSFRSRAWIDSSLSQQVDIDRLNPQPIADVQYA